MTYRAKTTIHHGVAEEVHTFEKGDELPIELFTEADIEGLAEAGAIEGDAKGYPDAVDDDKSVVDEDVDVNTLSPADKDELKGLMDTPE